MTIRELATILTVAAAGAFASCGGIVDANHLEVASVTLSDSSLSLEVGTTQQLSATVKDAAGNTLANRPVFWSSEDSTVARVSEAGVVMAVKPGSARIAASAEGKSAVASVLVLPKPVASVTVAPTSANLRIGETLQLEVTLRDAEGNVLHDRQVQWQSSDARVAEVGQTGLVRALAIGSATITATSEGRSGTALINVLSGPPAHMEAVGGSAEGVAGEPLADSLAVRVTDASGNPVLGVTVAWAVTQGDGTIDPAASVTDLAGVARAQWTLGPRPGNQTATATVAGLTPVTFSARARLGRIALVSVEPATATLTALSATRSFTAVAYDAHQNSIPDLSFTWSSSAANVAPINSAGVAVAAANGVTTITARAGEVSGTATLQVAQTVAKVTVNLSSLTLRLGDTVRLTGTAADANNYPVAGVSLSWGTTNSAIATVTSQGLVEGVGAGEATITAASGGQSASTSVKVETVPVATVVVSPPAATRPVGESAQFTAAARDASGSVLAGRVITWESSNEQVASVNAAGQVSALRPGTATITARAEGKQGTAVMTVTPGAPASLVIASGNNQSAVAGTAVPQPLVVRVTDAVGNPVPGVAVSWSVTGGGGTLSPQGTVTNALGQASAGWTLGNQVGENSARAAVSGLPAVSFSATGVVGPPATVVSVSGNNQSATVGTAVPQPLVVRVTDARNNPVSGVAVSWSVTGGGGALSAQNAVTNAAGQASAGWTLGSQVGENSARASVSGLSPVSFTATAVAGPPANLAIASGNNQSAAVGTAVPEPLTVRVTDAGGNPVSGVAVSWSVTGGGGTLGPLSAVTNAAGQASANWTLGDEVGENTARASVNGLPAVSFSATAVAGPPASLVIAGGNNQTATVGTALPEPLTVRVTDARGNPISGVAVSWTVTGGGGSLREQSAATDAAGQASARWTLGSQVGPNSARASVSGLPAVTFTATAVAGPPASLVIVSGNNQTATVGTAVPQPLVVRVTDASGNPVSGVAVSWSVTGGGGTLTAESTATNASGQTSVGWTLGNQVGQNRAGASVSGLSPVTFSAVGVPAAPSNLSIVSGNNRSASVGSTLSEPLVVRVTDAVGNPVSGVAVSWSVTAGGGTLSDQSGPTNAAGQASARWRLGNQVGENTARASASGLPAAVFSATAVAGPPASLQIVSGQNQVGPGGQTLPEPLVVRVRDAHGNPVSGVRVTWHLVRGNGDLDPDASNTNAQGHASTNWRLANGPPDQTVEARVGDLSPAVFHAQRGVVR